ncbi:MAG: hypothetical protein OER95_02590, partial [Acidimicrobiia bacterium]|nr:hypothetical protein [Acidimicrobiia bacterium]
ATVIEGRRVLVADTDNHRLLTVDADCQTAWPVEVEFAIVRSAEPRSATPGLATSGSAMPGAVGPL